MTILQVRPREDHGAADGRGGAHRDVPVRPAAGRQGGPVQEETADRRTVAPFGRQEANHHHTGQIRGEGIPG